MNKPLALTLVAALSAAISFSGCKNNETSTGPTPVTAAAGSSSAENPNQPVAKYNDVTITLKDVDAKIGPQLKQIEKQKLELRQQTAEQLAVEALAKVEGAKEGKSDEEWIKAQLEKRIAPPPEADIQKVWDENKDKMPPGSTLESMRPQIISFLQKDQQREAAMAVFDDLKSKGHYQLLLEEPRVQVAATGPAKGPGDAKVTIVEFSDFQCPYCSRAESSVDEVMEKYAGKVKLVFRHFPLSFHANAPKAAEAAMCAEQQGKFWEMHKVLFANQQALGVDDLKKHAASIGLDQAKFDQCLDSGAMKAKVDADTAAGGEAGVSGTPAFFINGKLISGAQPFSAFQKVIDAELAKGS